MVSGFTTCRTNRSTPKLGWIRSAVGDGFVHLRKRKPQVGEEHLGEMDRRGRRAHDDIGKRASGRLGRHYTERTIRLMEDRGNDKEQFATHFDKTNTKDNCSRLARK